MNSKQILINIMFNIVFTSHNFHSTTAGDAHHHKPLQTRSELLNDQNKFKHVLYTLLSQNYVDADDPENNNIDDNNILNDKQYTKMENYNFIIDYLKQVIREINDRLLNLDIDQWDTKNDNIMNVYKEQKKLRAKKLHDNTDYVNKLRKLTEERNQNRVQMNNDHEKSKDIGHLRFKRSPLERRPLMFHGKIFNFDRNMSVELKDEERRFATGVYLRGRKPEGEKGNFEEEYAKWQREQALRQKEEEANQTSSTASVTGGEKSHSTAPGGEKSHSTAPGGEKSHSTAPGGRKRRDVNNSAAAEAPLPTLPDFIDNFGSAETISETTKRRKKDQFENLIGFTDGRDPSKYTLRLNKFNPHPSAEYFVDRIDSWVSWAKHEVSRRSALPTTPPLSTLDYYYSKASMSRFFSLNPRYLQSTDSDGLNKWGGRQIYPRSKEDFTFDFRSYAPMYVTDPSEEIRSFNTWRDAVNWSREPSNRPSTHPYFSVEMDKLMHKIFKCCSCKTYETKDLARYIDHLYEHYLRNSLMIPSFEEILTELRRREAVTGSETWRREF